MSVVQLHSDAQTDQCIACHGVGSYYLETRGYDRDCTIGGMVTCGTCQGTGRVVPENERAVLVPALLELKRLGVEWKFRALVREAQK